MVLQYGEIGKLGIQIERFFNLVPEDQRQVIVFDDFIADTKQVYENALQFLEIENDDRQEFPIHNANRKYRNKLISHLIHQLGRKTNIGPLKRKLGIPPSFSLTQWVKQLNTKQQSREALPSEFREDLKQYFREDIKLLSQLLGRDLTHWTK